MSHEATLGLLRLHQRDALIDARERFAAIAAARVGPDLLLLSTCHRVECYVAIPPDVDHGAWVRARVIGDDGDTVPAVVETGAAAVRHLFRAAMGLDSVVRGEGQILGQLRDAYDRARTTGGLHPLLSEVTQHALHIAREVRSSTSLGRVRRSVGSLAVDAVVALLPDPSAATVLVVGAGGWGSSPRARWPCVSARSRSRTGMPREHVRWPRRSARPRWVWMTWTGRCSAPTP